MERCLVKRPLLRIGWKRASTQGLGNEIWQLGVLGRPTWAGKQPCEFPLEAVRVYEFKLFKNSAWQNRGSVGVEAWLVTPEVPEADLSQPFLHPAQGGCELDSEAGKSSLLKRELRMFANDVCLSPSAPRLLQRLSHSVRGIHNRRNLPASVAGDHPSGHAFRVFYAPRCRFGIL